MDLFGEQYTFQPWQALTERDREFFTGDEYLPLPANHEERLTVLTGRPARDFIRQAILNVPQYSKSATGKFNREEHILLSNVWGDDKEIQKVRTWLYDRGLPFSTTVYLLYDDVVVKTDWKIVVLYWNAFAWNVGFEMLALDMTKSWICSFHHEDAITFYAY